MLGQEGFPPEGEPQPSGSGTQQARSPAAAQQSLPMPAPLTRNASIRTSRFRSARVRGGIKRPKQGLTAGTDAPACTCSATLLKGEEKKLVLLQGIQAHLEKNNSLLERSNALQEEMLAVKKQKLEMEERRLLLAEAQFIQSGGAVPLPAVFPPNQG